MLANERNFKQCHCTKKGIGDNVVCQRGGGGGGFQPSLRCRMRILQEMYADMTFWYNQVKTCKVKLHKKSDANRVYAPLWLALGTADEKAS